MHVHDTYLQVFTHTSYYVLSMLLRVLLTILQLFLTLYYFYRAPLLAPGLM